MALLSIIQQVLSSTLYKSTTVGLYGKPYNTKLVGGASCPAVMVLKTALECKVCLLNLLKDLRKSDFEFAPKPVRFCPQNRKKVDVSPQP